MENKDKVRFKHMFDSSTAILDFIKGKKSTHLDSDRLFANAVIRELEILGEAANHISSKSKTNFPDLPWKQLIGMRNTLIHAYFDIDYDIIWETAKNDIPSLHFRLKEIVSSF